MKRILILGAILLAPWPVFGQQPADVETEVEPVSITVLAQSGSTLTATPIETTDSIWPSSIGLFAQAGEGTAVTPEARGASLASSDAPSPDVGELVSDAGKVIDDWQNVGWIAGVIALINLLLNLLRFTPINSWLKDLGYAWLKPLIATSLGALLGGFSTYSTGAGVLNSIVAGAMAGLGSVGFHELVNKTRKRKA